MQESKRILLDGYRLCARSVGLMSKAAKESPAEVQPRALSRVHSGLGNDCQECEAIHFGQCKASTSYFVCIQYTKSSYSFHRDGNQRRRHAPGNLYYKAHNYPPLFLVDSSRGIWRNFRLELSVYIPAVCLQPGEPSFS